MDKGLLANKIRDELKIRISKVENKQFVLLYKASHDGCSVKDFQKTCLNKGPTLTVLYGKDETVFGGYTSKSWTKSTARTMKYDSEAFLFYCRSGKSTEFLEIEQRYHARAITCYSEYGPTFGGGIFAAYDLQVFHNGQGIKKKDEYFELNGKTNFNSTYRLNGSWFWNKIDINERKLIVKDVEVYKVEGLDFFQDTNSVPRLVNIFADDLWTNAISRASSESPEINGLERGVQDKNFNIMFQQACKVLQHITGRFSSSYCRTLDIACTGKIQNVVGPIASQGESVTNKVYEHILPREDTCQIRLIDVRGFDYGRDYTTEFEALLDGKLRENYEFTETIDPKSLNPDKNPDRMIHALCIVIDATKFEVQAIETLIQTRQIIKQAHKRGIQVSIIATCMDKLCYLVHQSPDNIKKSIRVQQVMDKMCQTFGVGLNDVFPIINYTIEMSTEELKCMLALRALAKIVKNAVEFVHQNIVSLKMQCIQNCQKKVEKIGLNILCVGRINVGKSFFIDTIISTFERKKLTIASGGMQRNTVMSYEADTQQLNRHTLRITNEERKSDNNKVHFIDMPGFGLNDVIYLEQMKTIVEGHCPLKAFDLLGRIDESVCGYIHKPELQNMIHGVCFILDDQSIKEPKEEKDMIRNAISKILTPKGIPYIVVVTKMDKFEKKAGDIIKETAVKFGFTIGKIHVVKNYVDEEYISDDVGLPIIGCVQAILEESCVYYRNQSANFEK